MPDSYDDDDQYDDQPDDDTPLVKKLRRDLKAAQKRAAETDELQTRIATYERQEAVRAAKLEGLNDRQMKALLASHDGDMTPDAIRATAVELGFAKPPEPAVPETEQAAHNRIAEAATGAGTPNKVDILDRLDPRKLSEDEFYAEAAALGVTTDTI